MKNNLNRGTPTMNNRDTIQFIAFLCLWLFFGLSACDDGNTAGSEDGCDVSFPAEFAPAQVDLSYFQSNSVPGDEEHSTYIAVSNTANSGGSVLSGGPTYILASSFINYVQASETLPEFENGACVWDFSNIPGYQGIDVVVYATQTTNGANWEIRVDGEFSENEKLNDRRIISGFVSSDGQSGEWKLYGDTDDPDMVTSIYSWDIESENNYELTYDFEETNSLVNYVKDSAENRMTFNESGEVTELYWNRETDSGWIEPNDDERMCYTDFVNSACS